LGEPPGHHAVGIRDDTEPDPGVGQGLQAFPAAGHGFDPKRRIGELTVDVAMGLVTPILRYATLGDVGLEVVEPRLGPVRLDVEVGPEPYCGPVVRIGQHLSADRAFGPSEGPQDPLGVREDKDAAGVEKYGRGRVASRSHTQNVPRRGLAHERGDARSGLHRWRQSVGSGKNPEPGIG